MEKKHVFLAVARVKVKADSKGLLTNIIVCSSDEASARIFLDTNRKDALIISLTALTQLEEIIKTIKGNIAGERNDCDVYIDPCIQELIAA